MKISCLENGINQPFVYIWVEKASGMLVRITSYTYIKGNWQEYTETYRAKGKPTAVFGTIPSLPLDMPIFRSTGTKSTEPGVYEMVSNTKGQKEIGKAVKNLPLAINERCLRICFPAPDNSMLFVLSFSPLKKHRPSRWSLFICLIFGSIELRLRFLLISLLLKFLLLSPDLNTFAILI